MNIEEIKNTIGKREIEFRFWSNENMQFVDTPILNRKGSIFQLGSEGKGKDPLKDYCLMLSPWSKLVKMQYTGLLDNAGKKIFEGDIINGETKSVVMIGRYKCKISGEDGFGVYIIAEGKKIGSEALLQDEKNIDVIGNIFENPELLEINL